jgi:small GTP-binding protein
MVLPDELKVVLIGSSSVGKTRILTRATTGSFEEATMSTIGATYTSKLVQFHDRTIRLQLWDTAGRERHRVLTPMYFRDAAAAIVVYSVTSKQSFGDVDSWVETFVEHTGSRAIFLVGNKIDLDEKREVSMSDGRGKAVMMTAFFAEVSAKTGEGIEQLFAMVPEGCDAAEDIAAPKGISIEPSHGNRKGCKC